MKNFTFLLLAFLFTAGTVSAQKGLKLDRDEMGDVIEDIDWGIPFPGEKFPGPIMKKMESNRAMIQKRYGISDKQYNAIGREVLNQMRDMSAKQLKKGTVRTKLSKSDLRFLSNVIEEEHEDDNHTAYSQSGAQDIIDAGVGGAKIGAAIGAGLGAAAGLVGGPKGAAAGAAIGGAIGGAIGASAGLGAGAGQELAEEIDPTLENN